MNFVAPKLKNFAILKLATNTPELKTFYKEQIDKHNSGILTDEFPNAGFDLFVPNDIRVGGEFQTHMLSMDVKCEMRYNDEPTGYFMFPRSSISKTPLMLANHTGIIDAGYRGSLIGAFRNVSNEVFHVEKHTRLLQVCHPSLCPILVELVDENELSTTARGSGGFGSTGK
jgi:dUTP pyrophosphatase